MYLPFGSSRTRQREAQNARNNRAEIVKALSIGEITRRDLYKWGIFTAAGLLAAKNGLNPFVQSAFGAIPTGVPRTPLFGAEKFSQPMPRLDLIRPHTLERTPEGHAAFPYILGERDAKRLSWHTDFTANPDNLEFRNPLTGRGPIEGRPPGEIFAHQRWDEFFPKVGYVFSIGQCAENTYFHERMAHQQANSVWSFGEGRFSRGGMPPPLIKARYGEPMLTRIYNNMPANRAENGGFGRNETQMHFHNAHNGAESDGAANVHHFPGTFYDYRWSTTLARRDKINTNATDRRASGPDGNGGLRQRARRLPRAAGHHVVPRPPLLLHGRERLQGHARHGQLLQRSGPRQRGAQRRRQPAAAERQAARLGQHRLRRQPGHLRRRLRSRRASISSTSSIPTASSATCRWSISPTRRSSRCCRANTASASSTPACRASSSSACSMRAAGRCHSRSSPTTATCWSIRSTLTALDEQGIAERYDIVVDFSRFRVGDRLKVVNLLRMRDDGRGPREELSYAEALKRNAEDPVLGAMLRVPGRRLGAERRCRRA